MHSYVSSGKDYKPADFELQSAQPGMMLVQMATPMIGAPYQLLRKSKNSLSVTNQKCLSMRSHFLRYSIPTLKSEGSPYHRSMA